MGDTRDSKIRALPISHERRFENSFSAILGRSDQRPVVVKDIEAGQTVVAIQEEFREVDIDRIKVGAHPIRENFAQDELEALAQSLIQQGVVQPLIVRNRGDGDFELVAGERRLRAARLAGISSVPVIVKALSDQEALETAIVENAQRDDLNPIEEARAYVRLSRQFGLSQGEIARRLGKSRVAITNAIRLLQLPAEIIQMLQDGHISAGHGRVLLMLDDAELQLNFARRVVMNGLSVRALERLVAKPIVESEHDDEKIAEKQSLVRLAERVSSLLEVDARIRRDREGKRHLELIFASDASWKRFMARIRD